MAKGSSISQLFSHILTKNLPEVAFLKCCMFPIFGPFFKFCGRWGKLSHVSEQWANPMLKKIKLLLLCFLHYSSIPQNELSLKPHNLNCCGCLLVIILPHPWGKLIKTQLFGKQHFKGFCEFFLLLILPRICSQKIKDSQPRLQNSSTFMVSPPRSQEKRWLTLPHFPLHTS